MPAIARHNRAVAIDLPGFGGSDKPLGIRYGFEFFDDVVSGFLEALGIERLGGLAVHDIGGPIGLHWLVRNPERVEKLALLNTLVYPELSLAAKAFLIGGKLPLVRSVLTSERGLALAMRTGIVNRGRVTPQLLDGVRGPFQTREARRALAAAGTGLEPPGLVEIAEKLPALEIPVRVVYGERDRILPDVAKTMARVKRDLPQAEVTALPDCGHFLQEDAPEQVGELLAEHFADQPTNGSRET
jgi:haloalkane dehalogenase